MSLPCLSASVHADFATRIMSFEGLNWWHSAVLFIFTLRREWIVSWAKLCLVSVCIFFSMLKLLSASALEWAIHKAVMATLLSVPYWRLPEGSFFLDIDIQKLSNNVVSRSKGGSSLLGDSKYSCTSSSILVAGSSGVNLFPNWTTVKIKR